MRERDYYGRVVDHAMAAGWSLARWADGSGMRSPFDLTGCDPYGLAVGLEVKIERAVGGIPWGKAVPGSWFTEREHQLNWLEAYRVSGAWSLLLVGEQATGKWYLFRYSLGSPLSDLLIGEYRMATEGNVTWSRLVSLRIERSVEGVRPWP